MAGLQWEWYHFFIIFFISNILLIDFSQLTKIENAYTVHHCGTMDLYDQKNKKQDY
jgi:hypothetical protein